MGFFEGQLECDSGAPGHMGSHRHLTAQSHRSLRHSNHAQRSRIGGEFRRDPHAIIIDLKHDHPTLALQRDANLLCLRVTGHVR